MVVYLQFSDGKTIGGCKLLPEPNCNHDGSVYSEFCADIGFSGSTVARIYVYNDHGDVFGKENKRVWDHESGARL